MGRYGLELFARCASGFEQVLADELRNLGAKRVRPLKGGVAFFGDLEDTYRACLCCRCATRIQLVIARIDATDAETFYAGAKQVPWHTMIAPGATIAVFTHGTNGQLRNTQFSALKVKDAICDKLREEDGKRPDVDADHPDFAVDVSIHEQRATLYLNLSGESLHKRGYRTPGEQVQAPLKETLAAGMLLEAGWDKFVAGELKSRDEHAEFVRQRAVKGDERALADLAPHTRESLSALPADRPVHVRTRRSIAFVDAMCGSGTLVIEAALIAANIAPGILREKWGFEGWQAHVPMLWHEVREQAKAASKDPSRLGITLVGGDKDRDAIDIARECARRVGVDRLVHFYRCDAADLAKRAEYRGTPWAGRGLFACNPPYGQRLASDGQLDAIYSTLAATTDSMPQHWDFCIITPDPAIDAVIGRRFTRSLDCYNGPIETTVRIYSGPPLRSQIPLVSLGGVEHRVSVLQSQSQQFALRLRKVAKQRAKWARGAQVDCYRIYDADLPDYASSVDLYTEARTGAHYLRISEYQAPASVDTSRAEARFADTLALAPVVLDVKPERVFSKTRRRAKGGSQYREAAAPSHWIQVREGSYTFKADLSGHLDTGLFLDHRPTRELIGQMASGARFLNLFAYTGTASVWAAGGGASSTTTVDLSRLYLDWAKRNMALNGFIGPEHAFVCTDVLQWVEDARAAEERFDLIFCDPPTFSNSKRMGERDWDVQRDHISLLEALCDLLSPEGTIVFSCNLRKFKLDGEALASVGLAVEDITAQTIPVDFERTPKVHHCFLLRKAPC